MQVKKSEEEQTSKRERVAAELWTDMYDTRGVKRANSPWELDIQILAHEIAAKRICGGCADNQWRHEKKPGDERV